MSTDSQAPGELYGTTAIRNNQLERFENRTLVRRYTVEFTCPEFTCLCPRSGFPDFATIHIKYVPHKFCVELKSLKLYINQFRDEKVFHEDVTNRILDDLVRLLDPWEMEVVGDFSVRGNIKTVITSKHSKKYKKRTGIGPLAARPRVSVTFFYESYARPPGLHFDLSG